MYFYFIFWLGNFDWGRRWNLGSWRDVVVVGVRDKYFGFGDLRYLIFLRKVIFVVVGWDVKRDFMWEKVVMERGCLNIVWGFEGWGGI